MTHIPASVETCAWGFFDAARAPVATIRSGESVTIDTVSGGPEALPGPGFDVPPELLDIHARSERPVLGHILTGPVAVEGARPGTMLQIDIEDVSLRTDWGYNAMRPLAGILPQDVPERRMLNIPLDREAMTGRLPWGLDLPLNPFFGVMGVAPPREWGLISSIEPRKHGGNLDLKELVAGTTLYLPVWAEGALFSVGDGHGAQGDGEVCVTAIETALRGTFRLTARPDMTGTAPLAETPTHWITIGLGPDLDTCAEDATRAMIHLVRDRAGLDWADAFTLLSLAGDLRITQAVNGCKGVHMMLAKSLLG
ncbi:acetamidase/formamidase family protein [Palleronia sp. LCG004]|uniref:acetamidase/formamidase family protein n=1 Tax=Palleronia sp. LCG004 TaxID=3079304 RepID=UPI0029434DDD|nr:acetamidase/formamidase family protein [Palleronia sp. LCG004]WOI55908.1 acetamidase/formamidase family protein [Palleronia sp. LCG004]